MYVFFWSKGRAPGFCSAELRNRPVSCPLWHFEKTKGKWLSSGTKCQWPLKQALISPLSPLSLFLSSHLLPTLLSSVPPSLSFHLIFPSIHSLLLSLPLFLTLCDLPQTTRSSSVNLCPHPPLLFTSHLISLPISLQSQTSISFKWVLAFISLYLLGTIFCLYVPWWSLIVCVEVAAACVLPPLWRG